MALWEDSTYHRVLVPTIKPYSLAAVLTKDFFFINLSFDSEFPVDALELSSQPITI